MASAAVRKTFEIEVWYFDAKGKYTTEDAFWWEGRSTPEGRPVMADVVAHLRGLRDNGGQGALPGLNPYEEGWPGYMMAQHQDGVPTLILPPK